MLMLEEDRITEAVRFVAAHHPLAERWGDRFRLLDAAWASLRRDVPDRSPEACPLLRLLVRRFLAELEPLMETGDGQAA